MERVSGDSVQRDALKVARVQQPFHSSEFEVAALLEAPLAVLHGLAVVEPAVTDVNGVADLAA